MLFHYSKPKTVVIPIKHDFLKIAKINALQEKALFDNDKN